MEIKRTPKPSIIRLCSILNFLEDQENLGKENIFSQEIGEYLDLPAFSIRKDISYIGEIGNTIAGYNISKLKAHIEDKLKLSGTQNTCLVGLGSLGTAILNYEKLNSSNFKLVAVFDTNLNKLEMIKLKIRAYPAYQIEEIVKKHSITAAIITVPSKSTQEVANKLIKGGVRGIINFTPTLIRSGRNDVVVRNIDLLNELRILQALIALKSIDSAGE
ncbi:MAG: redox-sensing transcriptional repressor Rex [Spirochaetales bacterium]|nr:redox-sensing transcriptional repressor Rex [Spirochaetales bacterium]